MSNRNNQIRDRIHSVLFETFNVSSISELNRETALTDFGIGSLELVECIFVIEKECSIVIDEQRLLGIETVGDLLSLTEYLIKSIVDNTDSTKVTEVSAS